MDCNLLVYEGIKRPYKGLERGDLVQLLDGYDIRDRHCKLYPEGAIGKVEVVYKRGTRPIGVKPYNFEHPMSMFWYEKSQLRFVGRDDE